MTKYCSKVIFVIHVSSIITNLHILMCFALSEWTLFIRLLFHFFNCLSHSSCFLWYCLPVCIMTKCSSEIFFQKNIPSDSHRHRYLLIAAHSRLMFAVLKFTASNRIEIDRMVIFYQNRHYKMDLYECCVINVLIIKFIRKQFENVAAWLGSFGIIHVPTMPMWAGNSRNDACMCPGHLLIDSYLSYGTKTYFDVPHSCVRINSISVLIGI